MKKSTKYALILLGAVAVIIVLICGIAGSATSLDFFKKVENRQNATKDSELQRVLDKRRDTRNQWISVIVLATLAMAAMITFAVFELRGVEITASVKPKKGEISAPPSSSGAGTRL